LWKELSLTLAGENSMAPANSRQHWQRRRLPDRSQLYRHISQTLFLLLNVWIGCEFYFFVRYYETRGQTLFVARPAGVEGWLPIAALMNLKYFLLTGLIPRIHAATLFLLIAFLLISWLWTKSFCSWLCPVGTLSEALWKLGRQVFESNLRIPRWCDIPLRGLKYLLLGLLLYAVGTMSVAAIAAFLESPYGLVADVKMLNFFRYLSSTAALVIAVLVALSVVIQNFWCRYLCPYGALMGLAALSGPSKITRQPQSCIDCGKCATSCPAWLPVDKRLVVLSAECTSCLECVAVCPAEGALQMSVGRKTPIPAWAISLGIAAIFLGVVGYAKMSGYWDTKVPESVYFRLIPQAQELGHP
jgi:polyferredoxin